MQYTHVSPEVFIVRLDPGDDIHESMVDLCRKEGITNAAVRGIGSVDSPKLAHYRKDSQKFTEKQLEGIFEISSFEGNIALIDEEPTLHAHVVVSDEQMQAFAGHLIQGTCSATAELFVHRLDSKLTKELNPEIGLKVWVL